MRKLIWHATWFYFIWCGGVKLCMWVECEMCTQHFIHLCCLCCVWSYFMWPHHAVHMHCSTTLRYLNLSALVKNIFIIFLCEIFAYDFVQKKRRINRAQHTTRALHAICISLNVRCGGWVSFSLNKNVKCT